MTDDLALFDLPAPQRPTGPSRVERGQPGGTYERSVVAQVQIADAAALCTAAVQAIDSAPAFEIPWPSENQDLPGDDETGGDDELEVDDRAKAGTDPAGPGQEHNFVPVEWIPSVFDAIRLLTDLGVVVVEAGANGNQDLDAPEFVRDGIPWFDRSVHDSGALLVGAGGSDHERLFFSDYGSRFDLQGWGSNIVTTGFGDLLGGTDPANRDTTYTATFAGTSGAAAIVTGAVVAVQSYLKATGRAPWSARQIADLLISTGTPQGPATEDQHIGPLPNLAAALRAIEVDQPATTGNLNQQP